jgi:hypothetical protein
MAAGGGQSCDFAVVTHAEVGSKTVESITEGYMVSV